MSVLLVVLASVLLAGAAASGYVRSEIADSRAFSSRAASALDEGALRVVVAERIVDALTRKTAESALVVRPLAVAGVATLIDRPRVRAVFERALRGRHERLMQGESRFVLRLIPDDELSQSLARL